MKQESIAPPQTGEQHVSQLVRRLFASQTVGQIDDSVEIDLHSALEYVQFGPLHVSVLGENPRRGPFGEFARRGSLRIECHDSTLSPMLRQHLSGDDSKTLRLRTALLAHGVTHIHWVDEQGQDDIYLRLAPGEILNLRGDETATLPELVDVLRAPERFNAHEHGDILIDLSAPAKRQKALAALRRPRERSALHIAGYRHIVIDGNLMIICIDAEQSQQRVQHRLDLDLDLDDPRQPAHIRMGNVRDEDLPSLGHASAQEEAGGSPLTIYERIELSMQQAGLRPEAVQIDRISQAVELLSVRKARLLLHLHQPALLTSAGQRARPVHIMRLFRQLEPLFQERGIEWLRDENDALTYHLHPSGQQPTLVDLATGDAVEQAVHDALTQHPDLGNSGTLARRLREGFQQVIDNPTRQCTLDLGTLMQNQRGIRLADREVLRLLRGIALRLGGNFVLASVPEKRGHITLSQPSPDELLTSNSEEVKAPSQTASSLAQQQVHTLLETLRWHLDEHTARERFLQRLAMTLGKVLDGSSAQELLTFGDYRPDIQQIDSGFSELEPLLRRAGLSVRRAGQRIEVLRRSS